VKTSKRKLEKLSVVIPCLNEEKNIKELYSELLGLQEKNLELIFVDDGSKDNTWHEVERLILLGDAKIKAIKFTRNFGKEAAIEAGLKASSGNVVITLDADLEHPIAVIPEMVDLWLNNRDVFIINTIKSVRQKEGWFKRRITNLYFKLFNISSGFDLSNHTDFKLLDRMVVNQYVNLPENNKFYRGLINWLGYHSISIPIKLINRPENTTSWSFLQLIKYAKNSILSFSVLPLKFITWIGFSLFVFSLILSIDTLIKAMSGTSAEGFPTVILLLLGIGSIIIFSLGLIGEYMAEMFKELKNRPQYVYSETKEAQNKGKK
jgi:dolichol-phosphate mannosyltransferase